MKFSLDNIANLKSDSLYYLSDKGEIKEAGLWTRFKYTHNLGHSHERVSNLLNAVKEALMEKSGNYGWERLENTIEDLNIRFGVLGSEVKGIVNAFSGMYGNYIFQTSAERTADKLLNKMFNTLFSNFKTIPKSNELTNLFKHALSPVTTNPPTINTADGKQIIDEEKLQDKISTIISNLNTDLINITKSEKLGVNKLTASYAKYLKSALFDASGNRKETTIANLKNPRDALYQTIVGDESAVNAEDKEPLNKAIDYLITECGNDDDLDEIISGFDSRFVRRGDERPRSLKSVKERLENIKQNLSELRTIKQDNPILYKQGIRRIKNLKGKSFPAESLSKCIDIAKNLSKVYLTKVNANSSQVELYEVISKLEQDTNKMIIDSGMDKLIEGEDERANCHVFITSSIISQLTTEQRAKLTNAFSSPNAYKLHKTLDNIVSHTNGIFLKGSQPEINQGSKLLHSQTKSLDVLYQELYFYMGMEDKQLPYYVENNPNYSNANTIVDLLQKQSAKIISNQIDIYGNDKVKGNVALSVKQGFKNRIAEHTKHMPPTIDAAFNTGTVYTDMSRKETEGMLTANLIATMQHYANNEDTAFKQTIAQNITVNLPNNQKLSNNYEEALDQLSALITQKNDSKFETLAENDKKKVMILTSLISADVAKKMDNIVTTKLNHGQNGPWFTYNSNNINPDTKIEFSLERDEFDQIMLNVKHTTAVSDFTVENNKTQTLPGSNISHSLNITLDYPRLDKCSNLNYTEVDEDKIQNILNDSNSINQNNNSIENYLKVNAEVPKDYGFDFKFIVSTFMELNK